MPTLLRFNGLRVAIYPNDHRPAHVHVIGASVEAVFILNCPAGPPELRENFGFPRQELNGIAGPLMAELASLCAAWSKIHGHL
ncbi:MAG: DUF4160 domain-containing protein [Nevskiaceae bacterium]|jgi:hypothetical protein|nr:DUF4160 domain-containing protein [Nevskiaceae bacterium]